MDRRVAEVSGQRITTMLRSNTFEVLLDLRERFVPADALPTSRGAAHWMFQTVLVVMNILQRDGFGADVATTKRIVLIAAYVQPLKRLNANLDTTDRFADIAGAIVWRVVHVAHRLHRLHRT